MMAGAQKPKVLLIGGMEYNIPEELKRRFDIVKHVGQGTNRLQDPPKNIDYIFVLRDWASHSMVESVKKQTKVPVVWLRKGWSAMKTELESRGMLSADIAEEPPTDGSSVPEEKAIAATTTTGLSAEDLEKLYKEKVREAVKGALKHGEKVSEDDLLEAMSMAGLPKEDCRTVVDEWLVMSGIVLRLDDGRFQIMAATGAKYETEETEETEVPERREPGPHLPTKGERRVLERARLLRGLPLGPYETKTALYAKMRRYQEFAGLSDFQIALTVKVAVKERIVDDTHERLYIDHDDSTTLAPVRDEKPELEIPKELPPAEPPVSTGLSKDDAKAGWNRVLTRTAKERERLGTLLAHCRIEWLPENNVVCILVPSPLASWLKVLESTQNWGYVSKLVAEEIAPAAVVRFMMENGL